MQLAQKTMRPVIAADYAESCTEGENEALASILAVLHERTGTDFASYRLSTVRRRVINRMISVGSANFEHYLGVLRASEQEAVRLLERVTIKVSRFYRNKDTFDALRQVILPRLAILRQGEPLRLWSAGCGCGEEAYTLAMLLDEAGVEGTIEATDIDPSALAAAQAGVYSASALSETPVELCTRYFEDRGDSFKVRDELRHRVHFGFHDLTRGEAAPGSGALFDIVCCRNVLIYFDRAIQMAALHKVRAAVREDGYLCLGEAEWPFPEIKASLEPLSHRTRLFRALGRANHLASELGALA